MLRTINTFSYVQRLSKVWFLQFYKALLLLNIGSGDCVAHTWLFSVKKVLIGARSEQVSIWYKNNIFCFVLETISDTMFNKRKQLMSIMRSCGNNVIEKQFQYFCAHSGDSCWEWV